MSNSCIPGSVCPGCGRSFACGMEAGSARCWCAELPPVAMPPLNGVGCYCPDCLRKRLEGEPVKPA